MKINIDKSFVILGVTFKLKISTLETELLKFYKQDEKLKAIKVYRDYYEKNGIKPDLKQSRKYVDEFWALQQNK